jgi:DNA-binding NarL/FixJ family response regulator
MLMSLTPRERQVAVAVAQGASNQQVAMALSMATRTVECHLAHIYLKMGLTSRVQLAAQICARQPAGSGARFRSLSPIERDVAALVGGGLSNRQAARQLCLSEKAVEYHLRNIYRKLRITSRCQLPGVLTRPNPESTLEATLAG